jgi:Protein of unknown function (DUF5131)
MSRNNLSPRPAAEVRPAEDLASLARSLKAGYRRNQEETRQLGEMLLRAKELCIREQREWLAWLREETGIPERTARDWMAKAQNNGPGDSDNGKVADTPPAESVDYPDDGGDGAEGDRPNHVTVSELYEEGREAAESGDYESAQECLDEAEELRTSLPSAEQGDLLSYGEQRGNALGDYFTLEQWNGMGDKEKKNVLGTVGEARFNAQGDNENIEWALWSWNPVTGCLHNCPYCYARDIAERFYEQKFAPSLWPGRLKAPQNTPFPEDKATQWIGHKNVFVCSMADLFGRWVPAE